MRKILLVGRDLLLLGTRAAILGKTGADAVCCNGAEASKILLQKEKFDLVVLCYTLTEEEKGEIRNVAHEGWTQTKVLTIVPLMVQERYYEDDMLDMTSSPEPDHLLRHTMELLGGLTDHATEERFRDGDQAEPAPIARWAVDSIEESAMVQRYYRGRLVRSIDHEDGRRPVRDHQDR